MCTLLKLRDSLVFPVSLQGWEKTDNPSRWARLGAQVGSPQGGMAQLVATPGPSGRAAGQPEGSAWAASLFASPSSTAMSSTPSKDGTTPSSWLSPLLQQVPWISHG